MDTRRERARQSEPESGTIEESLRLGGGPRVQQRRSRARVAIGFIVTAIAVAANIVGVLTYINARNQNAARPAPANPGIVARTTSELGDAASQGAGRHQWKTERADLEGRIATQRSAGSGCAEVWKKDEGCYVRGRLLSRANYDEELARMTLRRAELDRLLELSR